MTVVAHVRGTCGSGKTTLLHSLLDDTRGVWERVTGERRAWWSPPWRLTILDHDGVRVAAETVPAIRRRVALGSVLFQGIYHSNQKQVWLDLARELTTAGVGWFDLYLPYSLEECQRRVLARRAAVNNTRPYDPRNMEMIFHNVQKRFAEMTAAGFAPEWLPFDYPQDRVRAVLGVPPEVR